MSGGTEASPTLEESVAKMSQAERYSKFLRMLHARKMSVERLSQLATRQPKNRTHVLQVLQGKRDGHRTWLFLVDYLTRDELIVLGKKELIAIPDVTDEDLPQHRV